MSVKQQIKHDTEIARKQYFNKLSPSFGVVKLNTTDSTKNNYNQNLDSLPTGEISRFGLNASYGFTGKYYYVALGALNHYITNIHLTFDEAKQIYSAISFCQKFEHFKNLNSWIRECRRRALQENDLFDYLVDRIEAV